MENVLYGKYFSFSPFAPLADLRSDGHLTRARLSRIISTKAILARTLASSRSFECIALQDLAAVREFNLHFRSGLSLYSHKLLLKKAQMA